MRMLYTLPVWWIIGELTYSVIKSVEHALLVTDNSTWSPEMALDWAQVWINVIMVLILYYALFMLLRMYRLSCGGERITPTIGRALILLIVLVFALPSVWLWFWTLKHALNGNMTWDMTQWRYFITACCQPYLVYLVGVLWYQQYRLFHIKSIR